MAKKLFKIKEVDDKGVALNEGFYFSGKSELSVRKKTGCTTGFHSVKLVSKEETKKILKEAKDNLASFLL